MTFQSPSMIRSRKLASLLLAAVFAVFQLLATAPLLHADSERVQAVVTAQHQLEAPAFRGLGEGLQRSTDECPICMASNLAAVLAPRLAVFAPKVLQAQPILPAGVPLRAPFSEHLRSRAPPAV
jgi:hypothetical protein